MTYIKVFEYLNTFIKVGVGKIMFTYLIMEGRVIWLVSSGSDMSIIATRIDRKFFIEKDSGF